METVIQEIINTLEQNKNELISKDDTIRLLTVIGLEKEKKQFIISDDTTMMVNLFHGIYK